MESCAAVEKELDRVIEKFLAIRDHSEQVISDVANHIESIRDSLANEESPDAVLSEGQVRILNDTLEKTKEKLQRITGEHREMHSTVSKIGKVIDRNFVSDFQATARTDTLTDEHNLQTLNKIIAEHYIRQGMNDVAEALVKEADIKTEYMPRVSNEYRQYAEIYDIWESINNRNLTPALLWAENHTAELDAKNSALEFRLHRLAFVQILSLGVGAQNEAIIYARTNFGKFVNRYEREIQNLMGSLIYLPTGILNSPYKHLMLPELWSETAFVFLKDSCSVLGIHKDSPLTIVVNAGCTALPALLNLKQVMQSRQVLGIWSGRDELPIEIALDPEYRFHSVFACPILRQQTCDENPPMRLSCGHVISRDALTKLTSGSLIKCPYCPIERTPEEAKNIYF